MTLAKSVSCDGGLWKLSDKAWVQLLRAKAEGEDVDLDRLGKYIGDLSRSVTDLTPSQARWELEDMGLVAPPAP